MKTKSEIEDAVQRFGVIAEFDDREIPLDSFARRMLRQEAELASNCTNSFPPLVLSYMDAMVSEVEKKYKAGMDVGSALGSEYPATARGFHSAPRAQAFCGLYRPTADPAAPPPAALHPPASAQEWPAPWRTAVLVRPRAPG